MAGEIQFSYLTGQTCYVLIRNRTGAIWNGSAFTTYATSSYTDYDIAATEQGTASGLYVATMPAAITPGVYNIVAKDQEGASPAETDPTIAVGEIQWGGSAIIPLSDLATSGQLSQVGPVRLSRGVQVLNFPIYLKSATDHVTPFVSGNVSGQISRDGASFGPLQSGAFTEVGLGFYALQAITSGDILCNTAALIFTATGISGGASDPLPMSIVTQRVSGQSI